jgi:hypothetical protein
MAWHWPGMALARHGMALARQTEGGQCHAGPVPCHAGQCHAIERSGRPSVAISPPSVCRAKSQQPAGCGSMDSSARRWAGRTGPLAGHDSSSDGDKAAAAVCVLGLLAVPSESAGAAAAAVETAGVTTLVADAVSTGDAACANDAVAAASAAATTTAAGMPDDADSVGLKPSAFAGGGPLFSNGGRAGIAGGPASSGCIGSGRSTSGPRSAEPHTSRCTSSTAAKVSASRCVRCGDKTVPYDARQRDSQRPASGGGGGGGCEATIAKEMGRRQASALLKQPRNASFSSTATYCRSQTGSGKLRTCKILRRIHHVQRRHSD